MQSLPTISAKNSPTWVAEIKAKYGNSIQFLATFNPDQQISYCKHVDRCFIGSAPSIGRVAYTYSQDVAESWLAIQIRDLSEYAGARDKLRTDQIDIISSVILNEYSYLKVTELMYFFYLWKAGRFGKFYGVIDPIVITESLIEFRKIRAVKLGEIEAREKEEAIKREYEERQEMERRGELVGIEYFELLKEIEREEIGWLFNLGYEKI